MKYLVLLLMLAGCARADVAWHFGVSNVRTFDVMQLQDRDIPAPPAMPGPEEDDDD